MNWTRIILVLVHIWKIRYKNMRCNLFQMRCNLNQWASTHVDNMFKRNIWHRNISVSVNFSGPSVEALTLGIVRLVVVVVFTLNRSFYHTTSAVPPVSFLIPHPREIQVLWSQTVRQRKTKRSIIKVGKSSASVPGTRAQQKKRHPRNKSYEKKKKN